MAGKLRQRVRQWWPRLRRPLTLAFFALVLWLLVSQAMTVEWAEVGAAMRALSGATLALAMALVVASYLVYSTYDLLGRALTGHDLPATKVLSVSFVSYAFNLNFGALVGGMAFRFRLYSRLGLSAAVISRVLAMSVATNWLGYVFLAGALLLGGVVTLPESWVGAGLLRAVGGVLLLVFVAYMVLTWLARIDEISVRELRMPLPSRSMALLQAGLSTLNWMLMGAIMFLLLPEHEAVTYPVVLGALLLAAIAGVISHVPAGLGVLEAVFVAVLGNLVPRGELLAGVLAYRALYYLVPLLIAAVVFAVTEVAARRRGDADTRAGRTQPGSVDV